jgi:hypothetical protein
MTGNQVVSTMFDFNTCNRMARFVLSVTGLKTLGLIFSVFLVAMQYFDGMDPRCMIGGHDLHS